MQEKSEKNQGW